MLACSIAGRRNRIFRREEYQLGANCFCARPSLLAVYRPALYAPLFQKLQGAITKIARRCRAYLPNSIVFLPPVTILMSITGDNNNYSQPVPLGIIRLAPVVRPRTGRSIARSSDGFGSGTHSGKGDATMMKHFTPPIVVPIALLVLIAVVAIVRMQSGI